MPPRLLKPKDEGSDDNEGSSELKSSKRRAVSSACIPCRKRKSKCDGDVPSCSTCLAVYRTECYYDQDSDHRRKGALKRDIQSLQQQNDALDVIVASLRALPEDDAISLLHSIRSDENAESIAKSLQSNIRLPHSFSTHTLESEFVQQMTNISTTSPLTSGASTSATTMTSTPSGDYSHSAASSVMPNHNSWFRTPQDPEMIEHLFDQYFCWAHPFYQLFSRDLFMQDFRNGKTKHCSSLLVHSILAFGCHYSDRAAGRAEPLNPGTAGDMFFTEARRLLELEEKPSLTTVQALGVMTARETSQGRDSNGYQYSGRGVRTALEMGLHLSVIGKSMRPADFQARKITFWAVFNLETMCSVALGRLSQLPRAAADIEKPSTKDPLENQIWRPYEDTNMMTSPSSEQSMRSMSFVHCISNLSELASDMVNTFYAPRERFTSRRLVATYAQYREWYQNLPDAFRLENTSLPHVLALHMYYYACVLHLFRPYIKLDLHEADLYPLDTCTFCANEISNLMSALRAMYGLRRVALPVTGFLLSASTVHLLNLPSEQAATHLTQAMHDFRAMSMNHYFAGRCVGIIRDLANKWHIQLPEAAPSVSPFRLGDQPFFSSPPQSAFYAPSIPRQTSSNSQPNSGPNSGSGPISTDSSIPTEHSPFKPPSAPPALPSNPQPPQPDMIYYPDNFNAFDQNQQQQQQQQYWVPFPHQGMPSFPAGMANTDQYTFSNNDMQHFNTVQPMNAAQHRMQQQQPQQQHLHPHPRQNSAPGRLDEQDADAGLGGWSWQ
ncbi:hypothetical protein LTR95_012131 [Oleoguttula sp. CCFEE 5521]